MNKDTLIQLFKAPYKRQVFIESGLLPTFQGKVGNLKIYDAQGIQSVELTASEQNYAVSAVKYGEFQTLDEIQRTVELYEIIVNDNKQIERSRVGLGALVKKHIIGNNAVLVNFAYQNPEKRSWRFSFIARDGVFQDGEMQIKDTHPKRYTYVFGESDETYKTALDRFFVLGNELEITINKIKDAFGVEAMSKAFFDEYRDVHYAGFVDYLMRSNFKKSAFNANDKDVRDFVKKLLGRIVFLYFLQKKGWLGAKDTSYKNGDKNFMSNFFKKAGVNDAFYANWLSKLFFDALNNERSNDDFTMPDGEVVKIPYLNGGLFEKESTKYDFLTFPADLFTNLFAFFDQYNFTIFEDSPEEHTVAVDPEMLGHIFENLLEDNKDKGAFYTPKEIVHYMTQESLIEYLYTQIPDANRTDLENFVKNKVSTGSTQLSKEHKKEIDQKLDAVKICDPAIGSGAFPMGLLQEIFGLKERIHFDLSNAPLSFGEESGVGLWSPATVKENIIQKSIYGVDIERGAVDIARLRFWLSLIVDEEMPKALPNLDYKIVVGNSLVSKFDDTVIEIDWDRKGSVGEADKHVKGVQTALKSISEKQKQFFESKSNKQKAKLKAEIRELKLEVLSNQLSFNKASYLNKNQKVGDMGFGLKATDHKKNLAIDLQVAEFDQALAKLKQLKENPDQAFNHFDWKLDFPEVLNPLVFANNEKIDNLNLQIDALNKQIGVINHHLTNEEKIITVLHFQANIAQNQVDLIKLQIEKLEKEIKKIFGTVSNVDKGIVSEPDKSFVYKVSSINKGINEINLSVKSINESLKKENPEMGFDIVIANPPYVGVKGHAYIFEEIKKSRFDKYFKGRTELFYFFFHLSIELGRSNSINTFITTNYYPTSSDGNLLRTDLEANTTLIKYIDFGEMKVFSTALGQHNAITIFKKKKDLNRLLETIVTKRNGHLKALDFNYIVSGEDSLTEYYRVNQTELFEGKLKYLRIKGSSGGNNSSKIIFEKFNSLPLITKYAHVRQGLRTGIDKITDSHLKKHDTDFIKGEGVFILTQTECFQKNINEDILLKSLYKNSDINKYYVNSDSQYRIIYADKSLSNDILSSQHKNVLLHLEKYKKLICNIRGSNNESINDWYTLDRPREEWIFTSEKIVAPQRSRKNTFAYSNEDFYGSADIYYIIPFDVNVKAKYLTAILNSRLYYFWYYNKGKRKGEMLELYQQPLSETPITIALNQVVYENLVDTLIITKKLKTKIDNDVPNSHISEAFEEVIDALVFELYFPEEFAEKDIAIEKYAQELFKPIEGLSEVEQIKAIQETYQTLREKDNPLRNQIKLMKIELKELLLPILSV